MDGRVGPVLGVFAVVVGVLLAGGPRAVDAQTPPTESARRGDLVVQFGEFNYVCCGEVAETYGMPSKRVDILTPAGTLRATWQGPHEDVRGVDASRGDRLLVATRGDVEEEEDERLYAASLTPEGEQGSTFYVDAPEIIEPWGIGTGDDGEVVVAGQRYDDEFGLLGTNIFRDTGPGTVEGIAPGEDPEVLWGTVGCFAAYRAGGMATLYDMCEQEVVDGFTYNAHQNLSFEPRLIGGNLLLAPVLGPGSELVAGAYDFATGETVAEYFPDTEVEGCYFPASADAIGDLVYILYTCEFEAQIRKFDRVTGEDLGNVTTYDLGSGTAWPVRLRVWGSQTTTTVILVHGVNQRQQTPGLFDDLAVPLQATPGLAVARFAYYQDREFSEPTQCAADGANIPSISGVSDIDEVIDFSSSEGPCDSQSDIGLNALRLAEEVDRIVAASGQPVVLVGYSMGAAIIRGFLTYATENAAEVRSLVSAVFFLAGAHDGSHLALVGEFGDQAGLEDLIERAASRFGFSFDYDRPAVHQLSPSSAWYTYSNSTEPPHSLSYFNYLSEFRAVRGTCSWATAALEWAGCRYKAVLNIGDGALLRGSDTPTDTALFGGAGFVVARSESQDLPDAQWVDRVDVPDPYDPRGYNMVAHDALFGLVVADSPEVHTRVPFDTSDITIESCRDGAGSESLVLEFSELIKTAAGQGRARCDP